MITTYIFLDTNVFLHCKAFTEINWQAIFKEPQKSDKIVIIVPYKVNEELDNLKKSEKKARNVQKKLRELKDVEFKDGITLNITVFSTKWSSLKPEWAEKLDENIPDCQIIAEILVFKEKHPNDDVYFITSDNTPYFQAIELGINTIFWRDDEYKLIFKPSRIKAKPRERLTDLRIFFENRDVKYKISTKMELSLDKFIAKEFPEYIDFMNEDEEEKRILSEDDSYPKISEEITIKEAEEKGLALGDLKKSIVPSITKLLSLFLKSRDEFKKEILEFYERKKEYRKYVKIKLFLTNEGNKPYNNVNIEICSVLEKGFELKSREELDKPEKPKKEREFSSFEPILFKSLYHKESNIKYISPIKIEKEKNDIWIFGYSIKKIQHPETLPLYPIKIKFPEEYKMKKIHFICKFRHDEKGVTKDQKIILDILKED